MFFCIENVLVYEAASFLFVVASVLLKELKYLTWRFLLVKSIMKNFVFFFIQYFLFWVLCFVESIYALFHYICVVSCLYILVFTCVELYTSISTNLEWKWHCQCLLLVTIWKSAIVDLLRFGYFIFVFVI